MANAYPILQSGFISGVDERLSKPDTEANLMNDYMLVSPHLKVNNPFFFSKDVCKLFSDWFGDPSIMNQFEFRAQVLKEAMWWFSIGDRKEINLKGNFLQWLKLQENNPTVSDLHMQFLNDTIDFILTGKRSLTVWQWYSLIKADTTSLQAKPTTFAAKRLTENYRGLFDNESIVQQWVSQPYGYEDLITTLFVILGERTAITTVNTKHAG